MSIFFFASFANMDPKPQAQSPVFYNGCNINKAITLKPYFFPNKKTLDNNVNFLKGEKGEYVRPVFFAK